MGHSVNSVQQTSQRQEEPQVQVLSYTQEVQEEITDSVVSFNRFNPPSPSLPSPPHLLPFHFHFQFRLSGGVSGGVWVEIFYMDTSDIHARRINAKEVLTPPRGENFIFCKGDILIADFEE